MSDTLQLGDISIALTRKAVKHVYLSVHPPTGRVSLIAPLETRLEVAHAYAVSRLAWIRRQQVGFANQARETPRTFVTRESHYLWGRRYLLAVEQREARPEVRLDHHHIHLTVRPGSDIKMRARVLHEWHKSLLHQAIPKLISRWEKRLGVRVTAYFLRRMKTRWGSANPQAGHIRLNTELVKKPKDLLEYVIVHEMAHLIEPTHNEHFVALLDQHYPSWRDARMELNDMPLSAEQWATGRGPESRKV